MMAISVARAKEIADRVNDRWGEHVCRARDVREVERNGTLPGDREFVVSAILQELDQ